MSENAEYRIRKLDRAEYTRTRALWESVFIEDTEAFLDYYYEEKIKDNILYIADQEGELCAMLHLNPYRMMAGKEEVQSYYIVAVATLPEHRHRGLMGRLLKESMEDMRKAGVPFTFLMPAAEAIYYPYGFRFFYRQSQATLTGNGEDQGYLEIQKADPSMCGEMAEFAQNVLRERYKIFAKRTESYYRTVLKEQKSQKGGILCAREKGALKGMCCYTKEEKLEFRESICNGCEVEILRAMIPKGESVKVSGVCESSCEMEPMIMGRILCLSKFLCLLGTEEDFCQELWFEDSLLKENEGLYLLEGRSGQLYATKKKGALREDQDSMRVEDFFSVVTGYLGVEEIGERNGKEFLAKISPLGPSFINEVV